MESGGPRNPSGWRRGSNEHIEKAETVEFTVLPLPDSLSFDLAE